MKGTLLLASIVILASLVGVSECAQMVRGYEASVAWSTGNPLQYRSETPRDSGTYKVSYGFKMRDVPILMVNPNIYDWQNGFPANWELIIVETTAEYFTYQIRTTSPRQFYTLFFNWIAIVGEESLQVKYQRFNMKQLNTAPANGNRVTEEFQVSFDFIFDEVPTVWTSFVGMSFLGGTHFDIHQEPVNIEKTGFTLRVWSERAQIDWIVIAIWATDPSISYTFSQTRDYSGTNHRWVNRGPSEAFEYQDYTVTDEFKKKRSAPQPVSGMMGFSVNANRNMRLQCQRDVYDANQAVQKLRLGPWWDTYMDRLTYFQLVFVVSPDKCAKLYSECNFQGEELASICETTPVAQLAAQYHGKDVKSIKLSKGVVLSMYEKENYQGKAKEFTKDEACLQQWSW